MVRIATRSAPRTTTRTVTRSACAAALLVMTTLAAAPALAEPPVIERIQVDASFTDEFLTEACGVPVTTTAKGRITIRTFSEDGTGPVELRTINLALTATSGDNSVRFRDVGADLLRVEPDGTLILSIIGQIPFEFTGVLKLDPDTGEVILEPQHFLEDQLAEVCAILAA